ncbi:MAG: HIT domain-containing protein [Phycisphaerae bacterium]|nr:HIT domain-containing protein [Phycisphaerae bacterium]
MTEDRASTERNRNLWAPWRMQYIDALNHAPDADDGGCFLCRYRDADDDENNYVLWRGRRCFAVLNLFPYTGGHTLIAPFEHVGDLGDLDDETMCEMVSNVRDVEQVLRQAIRAEGFNVGINIGRCAGAGLPGHLHVHVVPRWSGDTNFMAVFGDVRVVPTHLAELHGRIRQVAAKMNLPT